jgi:hypothetical protein
MPGLYQLELLHVHVQVHVAVVKYQINVILDCTTWERSNVIVVNRTGETNGT